MIEQKINEIFFPAYNNTVLITHKSEILAKSKNEIFDIVNNLLFKDFLIKGIRIFNINKVKEVFIFERT